MIPRHCRQVSVKKVDFTLTERNILNEAAGKPAYSATNYMALSNGDAWAVLKVHKTGEFGLFRKIGRVEIVALPERTAYLEKPDIDVQNVSAMVDLAERTGKDALVVKGKFEHISFVYQERTTPLVLFDVVPPNPPKILELVDAALNTGRIRKPLKVIPRITDLNDLARSRGTRHVMFPCYATSLAGLDAGKDALYLDQARALTVPAGEITVVGCEVSLKIFMSLYHQRPEFVELCPKKLVNTVSEPCLCRCCIVDDGHQIEGNAAFVPWGASVGEVEEALIDLFRLDLGEAPDDGQ